MTRGPLFFRGLRAATAAAVILAVAVTGDGAAAATPIEVEVLTLSWTNDVGAWSAPVQLERWPSESSLLGVELRLTDGIASATLCSTNEEAIEGCIGVGIAAWGFGMLSSDDGPLATCGPLGDDGCVELEASGVQRETSLLPRSWFAGEGLAGAVLAAWYSWPVHDAAGESVYPGLVDVHEAGGTITVVYIVDPDLDASGLVDFGDLAAAFADWGGLCDFQLVTALLARWGDT